VKLELEAALKREQWDEIHDLFDQCWKFDSPERYDTLADLALVIFSSMSQANIDTKYQSSGSNVSRYSVSRLNEF